MRYPIHTTDVLEDCANFLAFVASWAGAIALLTDERWEENNAILAPEAFEGLFQGALAWERRLRDASKQMRTPGVQTKQEETAPAEQEDAPAAEEEATP